MVTITDIADALGITPSTVSRALAGSPRVKEETRLLVQQTAERMGYRRNIIAANLRKGRSDIVGIVVPRINRDFFSNCISGAESVLQKAGYSVLIMQTNEDYETEIRALKTLRNYHVAGILMSHAITSPGSAHIKPHIGDIPLVQFDRVFRDLPGAKITGANFDGAYIATRHLIENGYKRIGTIAGYMNAAPYAERLAGYRQALEDNGMQYDDSIVFRNAIVRETGCNAALRALEAGCDALYSAGDFSALGAVEALKGQKISIPDEFGIVGTANEFFTNLMSPTLSSLGQHPFEMGQEAARSFLNGTADEIVIPMELHIRQSSNRNNIWQK